MDRRAIARATVAGTIVVAAGALVAHALLTAPIAPAVAVRGPGDTVAATVTDASPPVVRTDLGGLTLDRVTGPVERRRTGTTEWIAVRPGETIGVDEALRTGSTGAAVLELQDGTSVWLWPDSEISARRLDAELARVKLAGGRLDLDVPERSGRTVEVETPGGALASARAARFSIIVDGAQVATVASRAGNVDVVSASARVRVPPGMQTRARPGAAPEVVSSIPSELLLSVEWPTQGSRSHRGLVHGRAPAGVLVSVDGARVVVAGDGTFERAVDLPEGDHRVQVTAEDVLGRRVSRTSPTIRTDTRAPAVRAEGRWE